MSARADRLMAIRGELAASLSVPVDDLMVKVSAPIMLGIEQMTAAILDPEASLTNISEATKAISEHTLRLEELRALVPKPIKVDVAYVHSQSQCVACGATQPIDEDRIELEVQRRLTVILASRAVEPVPLRLISGPTEKPFATDDGKPDAGPSEKKPVEGEVIPPPPKKPAHDYSTPIDHSKSVHFPKREPEPWRNFGSDTHVGDWQSGDLSRR